MGVTDDLAEAMRLCEQPLQAGKAFLARSRPSAPRCR